MNSHVRPRPRSALRQYFRTPKGLLAATLVVLAAVATAGAGVALAAPGLLSGAGTAVLIDLPILRLRKHRWVFPDGALVSGLIVALILSPHEPWYVTSITAAVAVLSKYLLRAGPGNVFNPAAFALVATFYPFGTAQSWWGALPDLAPAPLLVLVGAGAFIANKVHKVPLVLAFLGAYYFLATFSAFAGSPASMAELYRAPDLHAALFFAFFMVSDPPTSPPRYVDQVTFGLITAAAAYVAFECIGAVYFLPAGLLVANGWEAWRRARARSRRVSVVDRSPSAS